jgi:hypothetical protein
MNPPGDRDRIPSKGVLHFIAQCENCPWHTEDYLQGRRQVIAHVKKTGHTVNWEAGVHGRKDKK